jgi:hypothetical protein
VNLEREHLNLGIFIQIWSVKSSFFFKSVVSLGFLEDGWLG